MIIQDSEGFGFGTCWWMMTVLIILGATYNPALITSLIQTINISIDPTLALRPRQRKQCGPLY
jgi:hypothetical protein